MRRAVTIMVMLWASTLPTAASSAPALRWEIQAHHYAETSASTQAVLRLSLNERALPAYGWSLYFNCASELLLGELAGYLRAEHVGGTLYRIRPLPGFAGRPVGGTLDIVIEHPEVVVKATRAPSGPYLVFDDAPAQPIAIADYRVIPPQRVEHEPRATRDGRGLVTAAERYEANRRLVDVRPDSVPPVLPTPRRWARLPGAPVSSCGGVVRGPTLLSPEVTAVRDLLRERSAHCVKRASSTLSITLLVDRTLDAGNNEAYRLTAGSDGVEIRGQSPAAVARGVASLRQLLSTDPATGAVTLPRVRIDDAPRFAYRGLHVDVARNFQRKEVVFHLLDLMARHKLNTLHLHLTDDEGWRLEIPGLPELTSVGATRGHHPDPLAMLPPAHGSGPDSSDPHGSGYYTASDYVAIVRYAADRRIEVIPEIEMPGHARAAVRAMMARERALRAQGAATADEYRLADPDDRSRYVSAQGFDDNVMNPALESTYRFIGHVVAAVVAMHEQAGVPLRTLHVGADELPKGAWTASPAVASLMSTAQLPSRQAVWDRFYDRVSHLVSAHGVRVAGWEEIGARRSADGLRLEPNPVFLDHDFTAYVWNDLEGAEDLGLRLANAGYNTVLAPVTAYYFDMVHNANAEEPGATWAPPLGLEAAFDFDPVDYARHLPGPVSGRVALTAVGAAHIRGLEGTLWSETMREPAQIEYLLLPRLLGLAERAWSPRPDWAAHADADDVGYRRGWSVFLKQVGGVALPSLDADRAAAYRLPPPGLEVHDGGVLANCEIPGLTLRFTTDGRDPDTDSPVVTGPLPLVDGLRVASFDRNGRHSHVAQPGH